MGLGLGLGSGLRLVLALGLGAQSWCTPYGIELMLVPYPHDDSHRPVAYRALPLKRREGSVEGSVEESDELRPLTTRDYNAPVMAVEIEPRSRPPF